MKDKTKRIIGEWILISIVGMPILLVFGGFLVALIREYGVIMGIAYFLIPFALLGLISLGVKLSRL